MTEEQQIVLMLKGLVSELSPEGREQYEAAYQQMKKISGSSDAAGMALCVLGAEMAAS
ncbi:hypothetical protein [Pseudomonas veronii]